MSDKEITPHEFREAGYLQEVNRMMFHPLGLALAVEYEADDDFVGRFFCYDWRDDDEGGSFKEPNVEKYLSVKREVEKRYTNRMAALGYWVQPVYDRVVDSRRYLFQEGH